MVNHLIHQNQAGPTPDGRPRAVLVVAPDARRSIDLAKRFAAPDTHVLAARTPLEGLWSAPDVQAIVLDRGADVDFVPL